MPVDPELRKLAKIMKKKKRAKYNRRKGLNFENQIFKDLRKSKIRVVPSGSTERIVADLEVDDTYAVECKKKKKMPWRDLMAFWQKLNKEIEESENEQSKIAVIIWKENGKPILVTESCIKIGGIHTIEYDLWKKKIKEDSTWDGLTNS